MFPHTAEVFSENLMECLLDWNIDGKLCSSPIDNASANNAMVAILLHKLSNSLLLNERFFHMCCCAHILNLIMKDGLDVISESIERIRSSVSVESLYILAFRFYLFIILLPNKEIWLLTNSNFS